MPCVFSGFNINSTFNPVVFESNAATYAPHVAQFVQKAIFRSIEPTTRATYNSSLRVYTRWANSALVPIVLPIQQSDLLNFIGFRFLCDGVKNTTITKDLYALQEYHQLHNFNWQWKLKHPLVKKLMKRINKMSGVSFDLRKPFTFELLRDSLSSLSPSNFDQLMTMCFFSIATFALLRVSEFALTSSYAKCDSPALKIADVRFYPKFNKHCQFVSITIRKSKTDTSARGVTISLGRTNNRVDPVSLLFRYLVERKKLAHVPGCSMSQDAFLFVWSSGEVLNSRDVSLLLKGLVSLCGLEPDRFTAHSFRIGGATSLVRRGVQPAVIKQLGRWKSNVYCLYSRLSLDQLASYTFKMANAPVIDKSKNFYFGNQL